jgi:hypothetical protein
MSNLIRGPQDFLLNTVTGAELGMYVDSAGLKHLVVKKYGIDIPASSGTDAVVKVGQNGAKQKVTLQIDWLWNGESNKVFEIEVTKQPLYSGFGNEQFPVSHSYQFLLPAFTTAVVGTLNNTDKDAIVNGLIAAIAADVQLTMNAVNTGAVVAATAVDHKLVLEALEVGTLFTVRVFDAEFSQTLNVAFKKATMTDDQLMRIFAIKAENEGQRPYIPTEGVEYACVTIRQRTVGYDNVVASGRTDREQVYNFYVPLSAISALEFATVTNAGTNTNSMADTVGVKAKSLYDYLIYLCGINYVTPVTVTAGAVAGVTAPVKAAVPVTTVTATAEYTGTVEWFETVAGTACGATFAAGTLYTAVITLTPKAGYTFLNIVANGLTIAGSLTDVNARGSGVITATFAATAA